jgi:hypothetical protein
MPESKYTENQRERRRLRIKNHQCYCCGVKLSEGYTATRCVECIEKERIRKGIIPHKKERVVEMFKMNSEGVDSVEHIIAIDSNIELRMKIPKVIDALSFSGLLEKSRKLLKLSEVEISSSRPVSRVYNGRNSMDEATERKLVSEYKNASIGDRKGIRDKYGFRTDRALYNRIYHLRNKYELR